MLEMLLVGGEGSVAADVFKKAERGGNQMPEQKVRKISLQEAWRGRVKGPRGNARFLQDEFPLFVSLADLVRLVLQKKPIRVSQLACLPIFRKRRTLRFVD
jgi:hypothetical protein